MKRIFPALMAVMIFCVSLAMAVPAQADIVNEDGFVTISGWYRIREDAQMPFEDFHFTAVDGSFTFYLQPSDLVAIDPDQVLSKPLLNMPLVNVLDVPVGGVTFDVIAYPYADGCFLALDQTGSGFSVWPCLGMFLLDEYILTEWIYVSLSISATDYPEEAQALTSMFEQYYIESEEPVFYQENGGGSPVVPSTEGIYPGVYKLLSDAFYGQGAELDGWQEMILTVLATIAIVFVFAVPFFVVFFGLSFIFGWRR